MVLENLTEQQIELLISSLSVNPNIENWNKEDTLKWLRLQLREQRAGGAWKARIREMGFAI
jgi:hypothetical protein